MSFAISDDFVAAENARLESALAEDLHALGRQLARRGISIRADGRTCDGLRRRGADMGGGHRRHALCALSRAGEPRNIHDKLEDCGVVNQLHG